MKRKAPGILPNPKWLTDHGYWGLVDMMDKWPEDYAHIRQYSKAGRSPEEWVPVAEKLFRQHGILPSVMWLRKNGYCGLNYAIKGNPHLFAHLKQDRPTRSGKEWVAIAETLEKKMGVLPRPAWLNKNGYGGLSACMKVHPDLFRHIKLADKQHRSPEEWVAVCEQLVRKHKTLPCSAWLVRHGYAGLPCAMKTYKSLFKRFTQDKERRTPEEWVTVAEELNKEHGFIPCRKWLNEHGYGALGSAIYIHPGLFSHLEQNKVFRRAKEWLPLAERLVEEHGTLPHFAWLESHGYGGLAQALIHHAELFRHIKQDRKGGRKPKEWVKITKTLAKQHNGVPCTHWLKRNGFAALIQAIYKHPRLFAGIKINWRKCPARRSPKEWLTVAKRLVRKTGRLPSTAWLKKEGYTGLLHARHKFPKLFSNIKPYQRVYHKKNGV